MTYKIIAFCSFLFLYNHLLFEVYGLSLLIAGKQVKILKIIVSTILMLMTSFLIFLPLKVFGDMGGKYEFSDGVNINLEFCLFVISNILSFFLSAKRFERVYIKRLQAYGLFLK